MTVPAPLETKGQRRWATNLSPKSQVHIAVEVFDRARTPSVTREFPSSAEFTAMYRVPPRLSLCLRMTRNNVGVGRLFFVEDDQRLP